MKKCYLIMEGRTDGQTEGQTDVNQYTSHFFKAGDNKQEKPGLQSHDTACHQSVYQIDISSLQGCGEIFDEKVLRNYGRTDSSKWFWRYL